ncbi:MAG: hypothetical protein IKB08_03835 [Clostridia bacterium]|nr:hypothetical protein [Clostridia bacterium]
MEYAYILFLLAEVVFAYFYITKGCLLTKMLASVPFVTAGVYLTLFCEPSHTVYAWLVVAGLSFSFLGDWVLKYDLFGMKGLPGIASFALAHILYISAFAVRIPLTLKDLWLILPWAVMIVLEIIAKNRMKIDLGAAAPAVLIYAMIIDAMVLLGVRAAALSINGGSSVLRAVILIFGVIMFIISDAGVCLMMFGGRTDIKLGRKTYKLDPINIVMYNGGQMLIAASVLL